VNGDELLRVLRRLAREQGVSLEVSAGRGDHVKVRFGTRRTVLPGRKQEIRTGTLGAIARQLDLPPGDLKG
jgi:hypothetical protein